MGKVFPRKNLIKVSHIDALRKKLLGDKMVLLFWNFIKKGILSVMKWGCMTHGRTRSRSYRTGNDTGEKKAKLMITSTTSTVS